MLLYSQVLLSCQLLSVCRRRKEGIIMIKSEKKIPLSLFSLAGRVVQSRDFWMRAELCSSVLAPVRNPGRQRNRECRRRGSHIHLV